MHKTDGAIEKINFSVRARCFNLRNRMNSIFTTARNWIFLSIFCASAWSAEPEFAWRDLTQYRPPQFEETFPKNPEGGKTLAEMLPQLERNRSADDSAFELLRLGLRGLPANRQMPALRWFGNAFIWGKSPQNPRAIELMYHAAGSTNPIISHNAIYFGLSTVRPLNEPILRTLLQVALRSEDPNVLSRIAWGATGHGEQLLSLLQPHLASNDPDRRRHAEDLRKIFSGEIEAFAWANARARESARERFSGQMEEVREALTNGDSARRLATLDLIQKERLTLIMDDSFIPAFTNCAADTDSKNRNATAILAGSRWIWGATNQPAEAIQLMLRLSRDADRQVRYNAMYYGLSTIQKRDEDVLRRMVEMLMEDGLGNGDFRRRIFWGWKAEQPKLRALLEKIIAERDPAGALFAYGLYLDVFAEQPKVSDHVAAILREPGKPIAQLVGVTPTQGAKFSRSDEFPVSLRTTLPSPQLRWLELDGLPVFVASQSEAAAAKTALLQNPTFKIVFEKALPAQSIVTMGKEGRLDPIK